MSDELEDILINSSTNQDAALRLLAENQVVELVEGFQKLKQDNKDLKNFIKEIYYNKHNDLCHGTCKKILEILIET